MSLNIGTTAYANNISQKEIVINIPSRTLGLYVQGELQKEYPVAVGKASTRTPLGTYTVMNKIVNPYYRKGNIPGGSPKNPLGVRWIGFKPSYGIHGNSSPSSIGTLASAGCVRMYSYDVIELYENVDLNTKVSIIYDIFDLYKKGDSVGLIVYPDVYRHYKDIENITKEKLDSLGIVGDITEEKIKEVVNRKIDNPVILSKNWAVIFNKQHITTDTYYFNNKVYISEEELYDYFGLDVEKNDYGLSINGINVAYQNVKDKYYIEIENLNDILGGKLQVNKSLQNMWLDVDFIKLNGQYLQKNESTMTTHNLLIPIDSLKSILGKDILSSEIKTIGGKQYVDIVSSKDLFGLKYNVLSKSRKIELSIDPVIYINSQRIKSV